MRRTCVVAAVASLVAMFVSAYAAPPRPAISAAGLIRPGDRIYGNPQGSVTIVDFYDTSCGPCRVLNRRIERLIAHDHDVRYVPVNVPILGWQSLIGARALVAAGKQRMLRPMLDRLMSQRRLPTNALMRRDAARLALDLRRFARDIASQATNQAVSAELRRAAALDIDYVPVVYIGHTRIPGAMSYDDLRDLVAHPDQPMLSLVTAPDAGS